MKTKFLVTCLVAITLLSSCGKTTTSEISRVISTPVPARAAGQTDVLKLKADPIPTVRVAFIGLGMRGAGFPYGDKAFGAIGRFMEIPGIEIVAICDIDEARTTEANRKLKLRGHAEVPAYSGDAEAWRKVTALPNVDLIYVATDWANHAKIGVQAMKDGKHVAIEVPAAMNMQEIWDLVDTSEKTRKHCMQLENCVYDPFELTTLNMAQQGLFGEIVHGEGAYIHELKGFWNDYWENWRMDFNRHHRGDLYPTHGLGPVCQVMNIHRGDKMNYLVSVDAKQISSIAHIKETTGEDVTDFKNGEHTSTLISTEKGRSILIEHNVNSPRPYSRMYQITGSKGFANKYPMTPDKFGYGYSFTKGQLSAEDTKNHEDLNAHSYIPTEVKLELAKKYQHPITSAKFDDTQTVLEKAEKVGGHGGMDFVMDYRLVYCLQNGLPLDMDVYDLAEWCSLTELTAISLNNNSAPVEIPDFTRGAWNKLSKLEFEQVKK